MALNHLLGVMLSVEEHAARSIRASTHHKFVTLLCFVVLMHILLNHKLSIAVSKGALVISPSAMASFPVSAHFSLKLENVRG